MTLFVDYVQGVGPTAAAVANKTALTNLTLSQSAKMITRIWVTASPVGTFAASKPLLGYVKVDSEDCDIAPLYIPITPVGGYLTLGGGGLSQNAKKWIVNCPCPGGAVLTFDVVADVAPNAAPEVQVNVEYSDGGSPFGSTQMHMKIGEPAVSASTSDNGESTNTALEIKANHMHMVFGYLAATTSVADASVVGNGEVTSDDLVGNGPLKFSWEPDPGGDANMGSGTPRLTYIETDRGFKRPGQKQTVNCKVIMRDAVSTAPLSNWGIVYS